MDGAPMAPTAPTATAMEMTTAHVASVDAGSTAKSLKRKRAAATKSNNSKEKKKKKKKKKQKQKKNVTTQVNGRITAAHPPLDKTALSNALSEALEPAFRTLSEALVPAFRTFSEALVPAFSEALVPAFSEALVPAFSKLSDALEPTMPLGKASSGKASSGKASGKSDKSVKPSIETMEPVIVKDNKHVYTQEELDAMKRPELISICKEKKIKVSRRRVDELKKEILDYHKRTSTTPPLTSKKDAIATVSNDQNVFDLEPFFSDAEVEVDDKEDETGKTGKTGEKEDDDEEDDDEEDDDDEEGDEEEDDDNDEEEDEEDEEDDDNK